VAWTWATFWHRDPAATARLALREDPARAVADALLLVASMASVLASVALSWTAVQTLFTLHYARLYHSHPAGGIDFNQEAPPRYADFAYLAFTVGMTFQVSDTALHSSALRAATLRQALLSYLLGAVILATTINLVAGLLR
jgi:uncharacterized membrane protein